MSGPLSVLVVAAHTDDEALGCGGTLARHAAVGDRVAALFMTDGVGARGTDDAAALRRAAAAEAAGQALGIQARFAEAFPDNAMDSVPLLKVVQAVERVVAEVRPDVIYTHHAGDLNVDHERTARAVLTACRPQAGSSVRAIHAFEVPSSTEWAGPRRELAFCPQHFVDVTEHWAAKRAALEAYAEEMRETPHPRSMEGIEALATWRGVQVGVQRAEAFEVVRSILR